jgi:threonyl-tRNA synthetase
MTMHDHRKLGRELGIFDTDPLIGAGLPYLLPAGAAIRHALEEYIREVERRAGYQHVYSPVLAKRELYEISGHWSHYRDGMYPPMEIGGEQVVLRPSLCPHHALIYRSQAHSYRDLPLRMAELGGQYRSELSGVLGGLTRVRAMQLNDAHIFCAPDQVAAEAAAALGLIRQAYRDLGIQPVRYRLSLAAREGKRDGKYVGGPDMWDRAAGLLEQVLADAGVPYEPEEGEAAFYGPKIDVQIADSAEREASMSTVQVDFYLPERFGLEYAGTDGARHRPVMVHRSVIGSAERVMAHLIDVHGGAFPAWLAPVQVAVLPVGEAQEPEAAALARRAVDAGLRAVVAGPQAGSLGARIHASRLVPYQAVIGAREAAADEVALRLRDGRRLPALPAGEALARIGECVAARGTELWQADPVVRLAACE